MRQLGLNSLMKQNHPSFINSANVATTSSFPLRKTPTTRFSLPTRYSRNLNLSLMASPFSNKSNAQLHNVQLAVKNPKFTQNLKKGRFTGKSLFPSKKHLKWEGFKKKSSSKIPRSNLFPTVPMKNAASAIK